MKLACAQTSRSKSDVTSPKLKNKLLERRSHSLSWFSCGSYILVELESGELVFVEGGKPENPEKNPRSKDENQQQTQPTYDTGPESNPGLIGGRRARSPLRRLCSPLEKVVLCSLTGASTFQLTDLCTRKKEKKVQKNTALFNKRHLDAN